MPVCKSVSAEQMAEELLTGPFRRTRFSSETLEEVADWLRRYPDQRVKECELRIARRDKRIRHLKQVIQTKAKQERANA